jgi:geranylgeranyl diphosphate synthase type I
VFAQLLQNYLTELDTAMRRTLDTVLRDEPGFGVMLRYAMGWTDEHNQPHHHPTGKRLRPALLFLCTETTGGDWHQAIPAGVAVEFLHNFSLIHDDIEDNSDFRHGRPTVWRVWEVKNAINAGDAMFAVAYSALEQQSHLVSPELALQLWRIFNATNLELTRGQHLDMRFEYQASISVDDYISMIKGKTAALLATCAQMGALIGSGNADIAAHYAEFGLNIGIAFQIRDDILGIWGDPKETGKSAASDIISRKKSFPVLYGLAHNPELVTVYQRPFFADADVAEAVRLLDHVHAQDYARQQEKVYYDRAMQALSLARPQGTAAQNLYAFVEMLFKRTH